MRLCIDLETTGLIRRDVPLNDSAQPHVIQLGAVQFDRQWKPVGKLVTLIRPDGFTIEPEAEAVHGISQERASRFGVPLKNALVHLQGMVGVASQLVFHNAWFDKSVIDIALARLNANGQWWKTKNSACTMEISTPLCRLPKADGRAGFKWPKLEEAVAHFYPDIAWKSSHDAEGDILATAMVAKALDERGLLPDPWAEPKAVDPRWREK